MSRYARQIQVIGEAGQARLAAAHVLVVGAGGLGVPVLQYLTGAGVGRITVIDPDVVEESNLHRQPLYARHIGQPKANAAAEEMALLNPDVTVVPVVDRLTPATPLDGFDVVLDCADSFAASYTLSDRCGAVPLISASVLGMSGYVGGFCGGAPSLRAVFPDLPETVATCATAGVMGPMVAMLGAAQAQMALAVLLGHTPSPLGHLLRFDGLRPSSFRFDTAPEPVGWHPFVALADLAPDDLVVDVRQPDLSPAAPQDGQRTVFVCRSGLRAWRAADDLRARWGGDIALLADGEPG